MRESTDKDNPMKEAYHPAIELILKLDKTDRYVFTFFLKKGFLYRLSFYGNGEATLENSVDGTRFYFTNLIYPKTKWDESMFEKRKPKAIPFELVTAEIAVILFKEVMSRLDYWRVMEGNDHATISKQ